MTRLSDLEALAGAATTGPWAPEDYGPGDKWPPIKGHGQTIAKGHTDDIDEGEGDANIKLICALRNAAPSLLAVVRVAEAWKEARDMLGDVAPAWLRVAVERVRRTAVSALSPPPARGEGQEKTMDKKGGTNG